MPGHLCGAMLWLAVRLALSLLAFACSAGPRPPPPAIANAPPPAHAPTCLDAAAGLERSTRGVRDPDTNVLQPMRTRCLEDGWPGEARACFAQMHEDDLGPCARLLDASQRTALFDVLGGGAGDRTQLALARARLAGVAVGIAACDQFVATVATALTCERMPLDARLELGHETATMWDLPVAGLPLDAQRRMARVCGSSLAELQRQVAEAGCMP